MKPSRTQGLAGPGACAAWLGLWLLAGSAQAQGGAAPGLSLGPGRSEMSMEWVRSSRPVLKPYQAEQAEQPGPSANGVAAKTPAANKAAPQVWSIELADKRLSPALQRWASAAGWLLVWEAERDFLLDASLSIEGDFLYAIEVTMRALANTDYPLQASANPVTRVLRISRYQSAERR